MMGTHEKRMSDSDVAKQKCLIWLLQPALFNSAAGSSGSLGAHGSVPGKRGWRKSSSASLWEWGRAFPTRPYSNEAVLGLGDVRCQQGMAQLHSHTGLDG